MQQVETRERDAAGREQGAARAEDVSAGSRASVRIGVLIPEFPGQTHAFFWRELKALRSLGVDARLLSTRRPRGELCHAWAVRAVEETEYLLPLGVRGAASALGRLLASGPTGWGQCISTIFGADVTGSGSLVRTLAAALLGARLAAIARRAGLGHIHVHSCANAALVAVFAEVFGGPTFSMTLHGPLRDYGSAQPLKWKRSAFDIVITKGLRSEVRERFPFLGDDRIAIAPMGVDKDVYRRSSAYEPYRGGERLSLISCARLHPRKGHQEAIRAVKTLRDRDLPARLTILGEGDHRGALEALVRELGLESAVELPGATDEEQVRAKLEESHIFVLASHAEPLGVAIMEAMAMEMPVVSTRAGGVPELVDDGESGLLASPEDAEGVAERLERIARDPELAARLGRAGRARIEERFHSGVSAEVIATRVRAMAGEGGGGA